MTKKGCTVAELITHLQQFPSDLEVLFQEYSDYSPLRLELVTREWGVPHKGGWVMQCIEHQWVQMSTENLERKREYIVFPGN